MFVDDLLLFTRATCKTARNFLMCLNLYHSISGQKPNLNKSAVYFPSWCNKNLSRLITCILGIKQGSFPFNYLGIPISPNRILISQLNHLANKVHRSISSWNHASISATGKVVLLNSSIFSLPNYFLSVMHLPDSILDQISKLSRSFLWGNGNSGRGFHTIGWTVTTLKKSEGGLGLRNLRNVKHSLMAKNIFSILNSNNKIWVDVFKHKYLNWSPWNIVSTRHSSWFFKSISRIALSLKTNFKILFANPLELDMWRDICFLDLPIIYKPTFLNMSIDFENLSFSDFLINDKFNNDFICNNFGPNLDWDWINSIKISFDSPNHWVWGPRSLNINTVDAVYDHLVTHDSNSWHGWDSIWKLCVLPRTKFFIWKLALGKLPTGAYLYDLNIGLFTLCKFCGLAPESASHIFWSCNKIVPSWNSLLLAFNLDANLLINFNSSTCLTHRLTSKSKDAYFKALVATTAWIIWKDHCNLIFNGWTPQFHSIFTRAWSYCTNYFKSIGKQIREVSNRFSPWSSITLYTDASWID